MAWQTCIPNILVCACCSMLWLLLFFVSLTLWMATIAFYVFMKVVDNYILEIQELIPCYLDHYNIRNLKSIAVVLYCEDKMTSLSLWSFYSNIQALLDHKFFMKDVGLYIIFIIPLISSQIHFCSSRNLQITAHRSSCPRRLVSSTSGSILYMI